jgi:PD-(D/E)XK endonuclease
LRTAFVRDGVLKPREQGDWGERSAALWLLSQGALVFIPFGHSPDIDLITILEDRAVRVQVKNCSHWRQNRWECLLCTRGGNQSWSGIVKRLDPSRYDYLFVVVADGRRWWIPSAALEVGTRLRLGGPKYAGFEVDPGPPIPGAKVLDSDALRGDSGVVKRARL